MAMGILSESAKTLVAQGHSPDEPSEVNLRYNFLSLLIPSLLDVEDIQHRRDTDEYRVHGKEHAWAYPVGGWSQHQ